MNQGKEADYSVASQDERDRVAKILSTNCRFIISKKGTTHPEKLKNEVDTYIRGVLAGEVFRGKDFENLVQIFRKKAFL